MKKNTFTLLLTGGLLFSMIQFTFSQSLKWTHANYFSNYNPEGRDKDVAFDSYGNTFVLYEKFLDYGSAGGWKQMAFNKIDSMGNVIANEVL
ncbi:MAG: hypothetical protein IPO27_09610 [Bacteroidetes bacterium]|nr:hypothetical protein [Bacteroidota bacterium]